MLRTPWAMCSQPLCRLDVGRALAVLAFGDGVAAAGQQGIQLCLLAVNSECSLHIDIGVPSHEVHAHPAIVVRALPRLHNGLVGGGAVFIRLPELFAAGAGIDHLIQDKMVHIGGSSGIAVFSGFLVYTFFNRWPPKVSPVNHIEGV